MDEVRAAFFSLRPEQAANPERNTCLLAELDEMAAANRILMPARAGENWEVRGSPRLPLWIQVVDEAAAPGHENYSEVAWVPELGCWPELKPTSLPAAKAINDFLLKRRGSLTLVPVKERSLEIFGDEKRLDVLRIGNYLFGGRLDLATIGAFAVPFPLAYRSPKVAGLPILVVENHNTYWSFGEWNETMKRYSAVVYGVGEAFRNTEDALLQVLRDVGGVGVEYFGDLDPTGVEIPLLFNRSVRDRTATVAPAMNLYRWMLKFGCRRPLDGDAPQTSRESKSWFGAEVGAQVETLWSEGSWMPQEALGIEKLRSPMFTRVVSGALDDETVDDDYWAIGHLDKD
ncbi:DUF2220 family protein [Oxalobacteraceae bacterium OTU3CINTB1]|nr:DUF2220 family protein [Oxalobacteraceae bacterium OTU3CINTB1]